MTSLPRSFFRRSAAVVAPELLGATIVSELAGHRTAGLIAETEAYLGFEDPASHAYLGRRHAGNAGLYGPPGSWYVYRSYGIHWCTNLVCGGASSGGAVLIRAIVPLEGIDVMRRRRGGVPDRALSDGPGKVCQALGITREVDGTSWITKNLRVCSKEDEVIGEVCTTPRIGISKATDWPLRFVLRPDPAVVQSHKAQLFAVGK